MKQKLFSILALLLMAATGAWAQTEELLTTITATGKDTYSETTAGVVTVSHDNDYFDNAFGWVWWHAGSLTVEAKEGYTITKCVFSQPYKTSVTVSSAPFKVKFVETHPFGDEFTAYLIEGTNPDETMDGVSSIEVYGYATPAASTYSVTLPEGTEDAENWTISDGTNSAKGNVGLKGLSGTETVTITYSGEKRVKSVTAVKKAAAPADPIALSEVTSENIGCVVTSDGNVYPAKTAVPAGKTAVGILGKVTETGHGLILALQNANSQNWNTINGWTSTTTYASTTLKVLTDAARGTNLTSYTTLGETTVSNWAVAQLGDYNAIFTNLGSTTDSDYGKTFDGNVNAYITGAGGTAISGDYWSATEYGKSLAMRFDGSGGQIGIKSGGKNVRPVLGF